MSKSLKKQVWNKVHNKVWDQVLDKFWVQQVSNKVWDQIRHHLRKVLNQVSEAIYGKVKGDE
jgi:hypothetical protein